VCGGREDDGCPDRRRGDQCELRDRCSHVDFRFSAWALGSCGLWIRVRPAVRRVRCAALRLGVARLRAAATRPG
jgi:hypothetical protein